MFIFLRLALTKLDILDTFEEIKVAVAYRLDGMTLMEAPGTRLLVYFRSNSVIHSQQAHRFWSASTLNM